MPLSRVHVVWLCLFMFAPLAVGHAQTSNARIVPETGTNQDTNAKPLKPAGTAVTSAPNSPNNSGQVPPAQTGGAMGTAQRATPADTSAADLNSPVVSTPLDPQAGISQSQFFELLFNNISVLNRVADNDDKAGNHISAARWRTHDARNAGLNDAEGQILQEIAVDCLQMLKEQDAKFGKAAEKFRAQLKPGAPVQISSELVQMDEDRKKIVSDHVDRLKAALGDSSFNKLDTYVRASFHATMIVPKPAAVTTPTNEKSPKESR